MTFREFQKINVERTRQWHDLDAWSLMEWAACMAGEAGEACNAAKKLRRLEDGIKTGPEDPAALRANLAEEIADTVTYAFLLAEAAGIDLGEAVADKFNKVSKKHGFPQRV